MSLPERSAARSVRSHYPCIATPAGLARCRFRLFPVRSPLLRESHSVSFPPGTKMFQFPGCPPHRLWVQRWVTTLAVAGFPHSGIHGSTPVCGSPWLIAADHALRRLLAPRHPPCALSSLPTQTHFRNGAPVIRRSFRLGEPSCPIVKVHIVSGPLPVGCSPNRRCPVGHPRLSFIIWWRRPDLNR